MPVSSNSPAGVVDTVDPAAGNPGPKIVTVSTMDPVPKDAVPEISNDGASVALIDGKGGVGSPAISVMSAASICLGSIAS